MKKANSLVKDKHIMSHKIIFSDRCRPNIICICNQCQKEQESPVVFGQNDFAKPHVWKIKDIRNSKNQYQYTIDICDRCSKE